MNGSITPEVEATIAAKVASGMYGTGAEVIREALLALEEREEREWKLAELRREIQLGIDDVESGRVVAMTVAELQDMKRRGRERRAAAAVNGAKHA